MLSMNPGLEALSIRLKKADIKQAAVIDEGFDPPSPNTLAAELPAFWNVLEAEPALRDQLQAKGIPCADMDAMASEGLAALWQSRNDFKEPMAGHLRELFANHEQVVEIPEMVAAHLEALKLKKVHRLGADATVPPGVGLVFLDFSLETTTPPPKIARRRSVAIAAKLAGVGDNAPFLVLFSSQKPLAGIAKKFREAADYLGGTFAFLTKDDARERAQFYLHLTSFGVGHPALRQTQQFFRALRKQLKTVSRGVLKEVMRLDVQDYAFIQRLALQDDGAPLGEYLLEIFGAVLSHEFRSGDEVQTARRALDRLHFSRHLPFSAQPSTPVQRIYRAVLTDPGVGPAKPHPMALTRRWKDEHGKGHAYPPLLTLGDVFVTENGHRVYVVLTPACDLQYSPMNEDRKPKLQMPVYLLPGRLESLKLPISAKNEKRTELLEIKGQPWRVVWLFKEVMTVPLGKLTVWQKREKCEIEARLSLPFALSLQQHWTTQLGRVGLPVNLPFSEAWDFQLYRPIKGGTWEKFGQPIKGEMILARHFRDRGEYAHYTFTRKGRDRLRERLMEVVRQLDAGFTKRIYAANALLEDLTFWDDLVAVEHSIELLKPLRDTSKEAVVFLRPSPPTDKDFFSFQKAALVVVLTE